MKKLFSLFVVVALAFVLVGCGGQVEDTVKIGVIGPLTGGASQYGIAVKNGAILAAEEINLAGGVLGMQLEIIAYDSKGEVLDGVNAYNRLVDQDNIDALVGGTFSGVTLAFKASAVEDGIPVLTPTATNPEVTLNAPNIFRACYTDSYQGAVAAVFAIEDLNAIKAAVFYNIDDAYSEGLATAFAATFRSLSLTVDLFTFTEGTNDYNASLTQIQAGNYDVVFVPAYVAAVGAILTQVSNSNFGDTIFMGGDGWDGIEENYATVAEGFYFVNHYAKTDPAANVQAFVTNFTARFNMAPNALAALAYDSVYTMALAMETAGTLDKAAVVAALASIEYNDAVTGAIKFDANGDPVKAITVIQLVAGEHVVIKKVQAD